MATRLVYDKETAQYGLPSTFKTKKRSARQPLKSETIARPRLMRMASSYLARDGMVALCSERGMGRHVLAADIANQHRASNGKVRSVRVASASAENSCRRVRRCVNESLKAMQDSLEPVLIVAEGIEGLDDVFIARLARSFEIAVNGGCQVLVIASPEAEPLFDHLPNCHILRARDLALDEEEYIAWGNLSAGYPPDMVTKVTHGIPALVAALKNSKPSVVGSPSGSSWDLAVDGLMRDALRPGLIEEEQRLRCAMAAMGAGELSELKALGIRASRDLLEETALTAPLFGANSKTGSFGVVPYDTTMVARTVSSSLEGGADFLRVVIRSLASRGSIARAALLASSLDDAAELTSLACLHPLELIDAGFSAYVSQALSARVGPHDAGVVMRVARFFDIGSVQMQGTEPLMSKSVKPTMEPEIALQMSLLDAIDTLFKGESGRKGFREKAKGLCGQGEASSNMLTQKVACFCRVLSLLMEGCYSQAYRELLAHQELRVQINGTPSVFSAVLHITYDAVRCMIGDPELVPEARERLQAETTLNMYAPSALRSLVFGWQEIAFALCGTRTPAMSLAPVLSYHAAHQHSAMLAVVNLVAAFNSVFSRSYRQVHVYLQEAAKDAQAARLADVAILALVAKHMMLCGLGESDLAAQISTYELPSKIEDASADIAALVLLYFAAIGEDVSAEGSAAGSARAAAIRLRLQNVRAQIPTLATYLVRVDVLQGHKLLRELPSSWREQVGMLPYGSNALTHLDNGRTNKKLAPIKPMSTTSVIVPTKTQFVPQVPASPMSLAPLTSVQLGKDILELYVMGQMRVCVNGVVVQENQWRRILSKTLLAYLALRPGHSVSRGDVVEQLWPEADYQRGRECLYTTLSSLRAAIGQSQETTQFVVGEVGRLHLNPSVVICDVDVFEALSRKILTRELPDDETVSLCMRLEELYGSGSYIPQRDANGYFKARHKELAKRFAEALLCGASAAAHLGDESQANWFSSLSARAEKKIC